MTQSEFDPTDLGLATRKAMPDALRVLLQDYPRGTWETHSNFGGLVAFWLDRHVMFRRLTDTLRSDAEAAIDSKVDPQAYFSRLSRFGGMLVSQLHGHHQIEDAHYFPVLAQREQSLQQGFDILDKDHHAMDGLLNRFTQSANDVLTGKGEAGAFHRELLSFDSLLNRHLEDEEDLIVPVILKHGPDDLH